MWDDFFIPTNIFKEGKVYTYSNADGVFILNTMVKVECPECGEQFIGNKKDAGLFLHGHSIYHQFIEEEAEKYGGV
tara:strand:+ start:1919 stop:2146 length:228 start_codon:yes stop_codon:yes gene_type:complete